MSKFKTTALGLAALVALAGCQTTADQERAIIGAFIGCAAGEIIDDGKCVTGAAIGAASGALADDFGVVR